ncbi:hypothetical protein PCANC_23529 [Puccinia coronata f. sp. avenae]|uniref:Integrase catalytic domain-containing protein n=1 Tax=Puccinia coronata f. sp. avenae TaxID=200324 RepID=A0A2N5U631_9BASI|nr:hypothetical protein PCANC_23529 [Puccinia coronata f. sp. avenae]
MTHNGSAEISKASASLSRSEDHRTNLAQPQPSNLNSCISVSSKEQTSLEDNKLPINSHQPFQGRETEIVIVRNDSLLVCNKAKKIKIPYPLIKPPCGLSINISSFADHKSPTAFSLGAHRTIITPIQAPRSNMSCNSNAARGRQAATSTANENDAQILAANDGASNASVRKDNKDIIIIPKFNGNNYSIWSSTMEVFLEYRGLWHLCLAEPVEPVDDATKKQVLEAWLILSSKINPDIFNSIKTTCGRSAHKIWERLKTNYAMASIYGIYRVWTNFTRITYDNDLLKYVQKIESALAKVNMIGIDTKQSVVSFTVMEKITEKRPDLMKRLLGDMATLSDPSLLLDKLRELANHEQVQRLREIPQSNHQSLALATGTGNGSNKRKRGPVLPCKHGKHNPEADYHHKEVNCWTINPEKNPNYKPPEAGLNMVTERAETPSTIDYAYYTGTRASSESVVLDSGASKHMFNSLRFFTSTQPARVAIVTGNGHEATKMMATRQGEATLIIGGRTVLLRNALYVPKLSTNLISFAQLIRDRAEVQSLNGKLQVTLNGSHVMKVNSKNNIFELEDVQTLESTALLSRTEENPLTVWHNRLGHARTARIREAIGDSNLKGTLVCDACLTGKMTKLPFKGHFSETEAPMQVIHGDLVGPISPASNGGGRYFLTLVDQHTGFIHVKVLKEKSDATSAIIQFKSLYEKQTGNAMKKLVTDGGGEFCNNTLGEILAKEGIQHNIAPPYTPQHNGVAERANRTIIDMTRCILLHAKMSAEWWGDAVVAAAMTTNCLPSLSKSKKSPVKLFLKLSPSINFLKPFGCHAWALKAKPVRDDKFDSISWKGTLLGYLNDYSAYRILCHEDNKVIHSRNVQFAEDVFPTTSPLSKSLTIRRDEESDFTPTFSAEPILPYEESNDVGIETTQQPLEDLTQPVEDYPASPETGR